MHHYRLMKTKAALHFLVRTVVNFSHVEDKEISTGASVTEVSHTSSYCPLSPMDVDQSYRHWGDEGDTF